MTIARGLAVIYLRGVGVNISHFYFGKKIVTRRARSQYKSTMISLIGKKFTEKNCFGEILLIRKW